MRRDGSFVVTKHPGSGGAVTVGTVTAQILYEIAGPAYANPDVVARFDSIELAQEGPGPSARTTVFAASRRRTRLKVCINHHGGFRNGVTFVLAGLDIAEKARLAEATIWELAGGRERFAETSVRLRRSDREDPSTNEDAFALLDVIVKDPDPKKVGRAFSGKSIEMALSSYPGFRTAGLPGVRARVRRVLARARRRAQGPASSRARRRPRRSTFPSLPAGPPLTLVPATAAAAETGPSGPTRVMPLGRLCGTRSGDKGGNANLGVWVETADAFGSSIRFSRSKS